LVIQPVASHYTDWAIPAHENIMLDHYISHEMQNMLIEFIATKVKEPTVNKIKHGKYFAILSD
jgi:hypothetical protein